MSRETVRVRLAGGGYCDVPGTTRYEGTTVRSNGRSNVEEYTVIILGHEFTSHWFGDAREVTSIYVRRDHPLWETLRKISRVHTLRGRIANLRRDWAASEIEDEVRQIRRRIIRREAEVAADPVCQQILGTVAV